MKVTTFNVMHNTVRHLIVKHLTPVRPRLPEEVALYVVIGFGRMGQTLAAHLAELAHFENRKRARLLILAENLPAAADAFLSRWGQFSPRVVVNNWSEIAFDPAHDAWSCRARRPAPAYQVGDERAIEYACNAVFAPLPPHVAERGFLNALVSLLRQPGVKPALIVCTDREQENYTTAATLEQSLLQTHGIRAPVFVWLPKQEPLQRLLTGKGGAVTPFGSCRDELRLQNVIDPLEEKLARAIMAGFYNLTDRQELLRRWESDSELFRHSNRSAATHTLIRLRCLGIKLIEPGAPKEDPVLELMPTPEQIKVLAQMEHNRWVAERLLAGFSYGPRSDQPPRRQQLCTWEALSTDDLLKKEPEKDFAQIMVVFNKLRDEGYTFAPA